MSDFEPTYLLLVVLLGMWLGWRGRWLGALVFLLVVAVYLAEAAASAFRGRS